MILGGEQTGLFIGAVAGTAAISALGSAFLAQAHYRGRITAAEYNLARILADFNRTDGFLTVERKEKREAHFAEQAAHNRVHQAGRVHEEYVEEAKAT